eukprot:TRINITY_DN81_c0_g1_i1.p1 TRINITY_DN81_c0_g1~~TRINITY_DN81_c0_g1_i1.p1  ORF type:complete len:1555 (-),score=405.34 TRINITY_DN81_c0_g1_i1:386-4762(-)
MADTLEEEEPPLYPVTVKGPGGEEFELQVSPLDTPMELRQFLADAPETCFYTCYDLLLTGADGSKFHLFDDILVKEATDISAGGCILELISGLYTDQGVRYHLKRVKDLVTLSGCHLSHSTQLAIDHGLPGKEDGADAEGGESKQPTMKKSNSIKDKEGSKVEIPEMDGMGFMEESTALLTAVLPPMFEESDCVKSISYSSFNPVPGYRRLVGDLLYLDVHTMEDGKYCVTANTRGFYINNSNGDILDPEPAEPLVKSETLVGLLRHISPLFLKGMNDIMDKKAAIHPFEGSQQLVGAIPWLGPHPPPAHRRDMGRAEEVLSLPYGGESAGLQRDWNEELQSVREMPRDTLNDRMVRDRSLHRVQSDFLEAAIKGVRAVVGRCIPPINPSDHDRFHLYVHNNIFFSLAVDGDFAMMQLMREEELAEIAKQEANAKATGVDAPAEESTPEAAASFEVQDPESDATKDKGANASEEQPKPQVSEGAEQVTYASANNDLKGALAINTAGIPGLHTLAVAVIDYRGHRCIAQSIVPGILYNKQDTLVYGSVDGGRKVVADEKFHAKAEELGKALSLSPSTLVDGDGKEVTLAIAADCKGIRGMDDRHYILDLVRTTPRDTNYMGPGSKTMILRSELVAAFIKAEQEERYEALKLEKPDEAKNMKSTDIIVTLNPNVFTDVKFGGDAEVVATEEKLVKKAGTYLVDTVLPKVVADLTSLDLTPLDGPTLADVLHSRGVNIRYLGRLAKLVDHLEHIKSLCISEMIVRAAKHVFKAVLRETMDHDVGGALAHLLNCFIGTQPAEQAAIEVPAAPVEKAPSPAAASGEEKTDERKKGRRSRSPAKSRKDKKGSKIAHVPEETSDVTAVPAADEAKAAPESTTDGAATEEKKAEEIPEFGYKRITGAMVWSDIREATRFKYGYVLPDDIHTNYRKMSAIRSLCLKLGLTMAARPYNLDSERPFEPSDLLDMQPVAKYAWPVSKDAQVNMEAAKVLLTQVGLPLEPSVVGTPRLPHWFKSHEAKLNEAYNLLNDACNILTNVCGPLWPEVAELCRLMAMVQFHAGNPEAAIMQQHRELVINERITGIDHPITAKSYANMALFYHALGHTELALKHMSRTLQLLTVTTAKDHPDCASIFVNVAMMYQDNNKMNVALRYLQEALTRNEKLLGPDHLQVAICFHALALSFAAMGAYKLSHQHEKSTYNILLKRLGENDPRTRESAMWLSEFQARDLQAQVKKQNQRGELASQQAAFRAAQNAQTQEMLRVLQAAAASAGGAGVPGAGRGTAQRPQGPRGGVQREATPGLRARGVDERAARATAEVRKKAERKGLNVRPGAGSGATATGAAAAQGGFEDLLSFINGGLIGGRPGSGAAKNGNLTPKTSTVAGGAPSPKGEPVVRKGWTGGTGSPSTSGQSGDVEPALLPESAASAVSEVVNGPPLGLGLGLGDMDSKKKKPKSKKVVASAK